MTFARPGSGLDPACRRAVQRVESQPSEEQPFTGVTFTCKKGLRRM